MKYEMATKLKKGDKVRKWSTGEFLTVDHIDTTRYAKVVLVGCYGQERYISHKNLEKLTTVFLGGTCANSTWREDLIPMLNIEYFNPVVDDWTEECYQEELRQRDICDYCLYVLTPKMEGFYSIAEVVDDSNKRPEKTVLCILEKDEDLNFNEFQMKSLRKVGAMVEANGGKCCTSLEEVANYLNA